VFISFVAFRFVICFGVVSTILGWFVVQVVVCGGVYLVMLF